MTIDQKKKMSLIEIGAVIIFSYNAFIYNLKISNELGKLNFQIQQKQDGF